MENRKDYRMYSVVLSALSPMQKGIQALHSTVAYITQNRPRYHYDVDQWMKRDKTAIILDGGSKREMDDLQVAIFDTGIAAPVSFEEEDLDYMTTSFSILVSNEIYGMTKEEMEITEEDDSYTKRKKELAQILSSLRLAR